MLGTAVVIGLALVVQNQSVDLPNRYRDAAVRAFKNQEFDTAKVYFQRLVVLDGGLDATRFDQAQTLAALGETDRAKAIMVDLAPQGEAGYAHAHLWQAEQLLSDPETYKSEDLLRISVAHLLRAKKGLPRSSKVDLRLSQYYVAVGLPKVAIRYLKNAARRQVELYFDLMLLYASTGDMESAKQSGEQVNAFYSELLKTNPDNADARLRFASIRMNLGDYEGAVALLEAGVTLHPTGRFRDALVAAHIAQYDREHKKDGPPLTRIKLLRRALELDPQNENALDRVLAMGVGNNESENADELLEWLLTKGSDNPFVHFVIGCRAWWRDDVEASTWHFERSYKLDQELGPIANNLAWILAHREVPQLDRALHLINTVLDRWPDSAAYRDTRGQILVRLERWNDALDDLEFALRTYPNNRQVHQALATVYSNLDHERLARKHSEIANRLANRGQGSPDK